MRDNEKQVITREVIEKELLLKRKSNDLVLLSLLIPIVLYFIYYICVIVYRLDLTSIKFVLTFALLTGAGIFLVVYYLYNLLKFRNSKSYKITLGRLHHKYQYPRGVFAYFHNNYKLYFDSRLTCSRPGIGFFNISDSLAYKEANDNDEFFIVQCGKQVLSAFNTRYFELDKELEKELRN